MISAVILTKNESDNIADCLKSLNWCSEIVIVDDLSADGTVDVIERLKDEFKKNGTVIRIYKRSLNADFSAQRNFAMSKVNNEWILFIDADERVPELLKDEILKRMNGLSDFAGFFIKRRDYFYNKPLLHGETAGLKFIRLARLNTGLWQGRVHEIWKIKGKTDVFQNHLDHFPHKNVAGFLSKINRYSDYVAQSWKEQGRSISSWQILIYPVIKFINNYIVKLGFLDGVPGLIMAVMMSFHSFLVRGKYLTRYQ